MTKRSIISRAKKLIDDEIQTKITDFTIKFIIDMVNKTTILGTKTAIPDYPTCKTLDAVDNPHPDINYVTRFTCPEFTSICPVTGQPDFAQIFIDYIADKSIIESKSLKLYLGSYRNHGAFHEDCTIGIAKDIIKTIKPKWFRICGYWYPRGGIPIDIFYEYNTPPEKCLIPNMPIFDYKGRG